MHLQSAQPAVVVNKSQLPEFVHEEIHAASGGPDQLCQSLSTTIPGTVHKIIPSRRRSQPEEAQIAVDEGDHRHRDLRIENTLTDENGDYVRLKKGAHDGSAPGQGGKNMPLTAMKSAEMFQANEALRRDKRSMNSETGMKAILESVAELFQYIQQKCADINAQGYLQIKCGADSNERQVNQLCVMTNGQVGLKVIWHQPYANTLDKSLLLIQEFATCLILPAESHLMYYDQPRHINEAKYLPDLSLTREYGWRQDADESEFVSSATLAEQIVMLFVDLVNRKASGQIKR